MSIGNQQQQTIMHNMFLLKTYCEKNGFKGWDPYDGLNSKVFQSLPFLKHRYVPREILIQLCKRSPINFRRLLMIPKDYNAKGLALLLQGYCNLYEAICNRNELAGIYGDNCAILKNIEYLSDLIISLQSKGNYHGACWGYNFDWQSKAFFLPAYTPTVVATSFVVEALLSAYDIMKNERYREVAMTSADFIIYDLNRIEKKKGFMFSYSPLDNRAVYNASLLGSKTLSLIYKYTGNDQLKDIAKETVQAVCDIQNEDGSFPHSDQAGNIWRDSFHTGFKLESLYYYQQLCGDDTFSSNIENGYNYWLNNFFEKETGIAKYYDRGQHEGYIDLHCFAQSIPTFFKLNKISTQQELVEKEIMWAFNNMWSKRGYFYFQKKNGIITRTAYMRWPNAWCFYGLSYWVLFKSQQNYD